MSEAMEFHIDVGVDGGFVWRALDADGTELVRSEPLASRQACVRAILVFKVEAPSAQILDLVRTRELRPPSPPPVRRRPATAFVKLPGGARRTSRRHGRSAPT